ncbi:hypothetical protein D3C76_1747750 [compost metagenome]
MLGSLKAGEVDLVTQGRLTETFRQLLMGSGLVALLGLVAAVALPDRQVRGRARLKRPHTKRLILC